VTSAINRYYDPSTDQFLSIDPDVATTDQPYVFTNDDPLNAEDPTGLCVDAGGGCETAEAYERAQAAAAAVKKEEASIAKLVAADKKGLASIEAYAKGLPAPLANAEGITGDAKNFLARAASKLSGQYAYLANLSYATYNLYKAYQASPFVGTLGANARVAVNWYKTSAAQAQVEQASEVATEAEEAGAMGLEQAGEDFLGSLFP
jgi:hypothetical protein